VRSGVVDPGELELGWQALSMQTPSSRPTARQSESVWHCVRAESNKIVQPLVLHASTRLQMGA
jgi:hypothetical protein